MKIIFTGGGTGGHIYPAIALIKSIREKKDNIDILYIGKINSEEERLCKKYRVSFIGINVSCLYRKMVIKNIKTFYFFLKAYFKVKKIIKSFEPDIIIGTGGYVSAPVIYAGAKSKVKTIIHEQNSIPGLTNKFLARFVSKVAISMSSSKSYFPTDKVVLTGNPRSQEVVQCKKVEKKQLGLSENKKLLLIFMGSLGAKYVNEKIIKSLPKLSKIKNLEIVFVTGKLHYNNIISEVKKLNIGENVFIKSYVDNMPQYYQYTDLVICRAGATTIAEISAIGIPSILIPSPFVTNNHQEKNAYDLVKNGGAIMIKEKELNENKLIDIVDNLINDVYRLQLLKINNKKRGINDSCTRFIKLIDMLVGS